MPSLEPALLLSLRLLGPLGRTLLSAPLFGCSWSSWHPCLVQQPCSSLFTPWRNFSFKAPLVDITVSSSVLCHLPVFTAAPGCLGAWLTVLLLRIHSHVSVTSCSCKGLACTVGQVVHCTIQTRPDVAWPTAAQWGASACACTAEVFLSVHLLTVSWFSQVHATSALHPGWSCHAEITNLTPHLLPFRRPACLLVPVRGSPRLPGPLCSPCCQTLFLLSPCSPPLVQPPSPHLQTHWRLPSCKTQAPPAAALSQVGFAPPPRKHFPHWLPLPGSPNNILRPCGHSGGHTQPLLHLRLLQSRMPPALWPP